jgi:hypothetical protein
MIPRFRILAVLTAMVPLAAATDWAANMAPRDGWDARRRAHDHATLVWTT